MNNMVKPNSILRKIWGKGDTILFIFAGAAAEFALNKSVDWLYFTGKLPQDPLGRLFSTVRYARMIVFSSEEDAYAAIDTINKIHQAVEQKRGAGIPDWAYRDVLYMLIHYSIKAYEVLEAPLSEAEKQEVYDVFYRVGLRMELKDLPASYNQWIPARQAHLMANLQKTDLTVDLFRQYKKHLGGFRYLLLCEGQKLVVPNRVSELLAYKKFSLLSLILPLYKFSRRIKLDRAFRNLLLPADYINQINDLDIAEKGN